jgi:hypothetical protein
MKEEYHRRSEVVSEAYEQFILRGCHQLVSRIITISGRFITMLLTRIPGTLENAAATSDAGIQCTPAGLHSPFA